MASNAALLAACVPGSTAPVSSAAVSIPPPASILSLAPEIREMIYEYAEIVSLYSRVSVYGSIRAGPIPARRSSLGLMYTCRRFYDHCRRFLVRNTHFHFASSRAYQLIAVAHQLSTHRGRPLRPVLHSAYLAFGGNAGQFRGTFSTRILTLVLLRVALSYGLGIRRLEIIFPYDYALPSRVSNWIQYSEWVRQLRFAVGYIRDVEFCWAAQYLGLPRLALEDQDLSSIEQAALNPVPARPRPILPLNPYAAVFIPGAAGHNPWRLALEAGLLDL